MPIRPIDVIILFCIWFGSLLGIVLNLLVMMLSLVSKEISGTYMFYIFNLASLDFLSAVTWVITGYYLTFHWYQSESSPALCYVQMLGEDFSITVTILALIPMSIHRRLAIDYANHGWFKIVFGKIAIIFYCSLAYIYGIGMGIVRFINTITLPYQHAPDNRAWCNATVQDQKVDDVQKYVERVFRYGSLVLVMILVLSLYFRMRKHVRQIQPTQANGENTQESKNLAVAILMQAIASLIGHLPIAIFYVFYFYTTVFKHTTQLFMFYVIDIALIFHISNYVLDPIMTLFMVKPYRRAFKKLIDKIRGTKTTVPIIAAPYGTGNGSKRLRPINYESPI
uniref:G-protein coupled receptors family 1 profile domain-containing protein n=1 Tax=Plectus sambesii TaxID=2011161 RepID=A0A914VJT5_9BILA